MAPSSPPQERRTYSLHEAAAILGASHDALTRHWPQLGGFRVGKLIRFPRATIDALVAGPAPADAPPVAPAPAVGPAGAELLRQLVREAHVAITIQRRESNDPYTRTECAERKAALDELLLDALDEIEGASRARGVA